MTTEEQLATEKKGISGNPTRRVVLGLALLAPVGLCCLTSMAIPTLRTLVTSLQDVRPIARGSEFVGLENYAFLFQGPMFSRALGFTLLQVVVRLLVVAVIPLLLALAVSAFGRSVRVPVRVLFTIPLALFAPVALTLVAGMVLDPRMGLFQKPPLATPGSARLASLLVDGLITFGLACGLGLIFYLAALRPSDEEAATRKKLVAPLVASWIIGLLTTVALTLQSFTLSTVLTAGGPGNATSTLALTQYNLAFRTLRFGTASAIASLTLIVLAILGLLAGLLVVLTGMRLELIPRGNQSESPGGKSGLGCNRNLAVVLLVVTLLISLGLCSLSTLPLPWTVLNSLKDRADMAGSAALFPSSPSLDAYKQIGQRVSLGRLLLNSVLPSFLVVFLVQIPFAYLGALGIGALRPLGKRSEWLLLLFSPWLFVTVMPLSIVALQRLIAAGQVNTFLALFSPILLSVPILFILTLFFKGQESQWRSAQVQDGTGAGTFFQKLILPSLPLTALLAFAALLVSMQNLLWPLIGVSRLENHTVQVTLLMLRQEFAASGPLLAAGLTMFGVPIFVFFFLVFALIQVLYLDRLALRAQVFGAEKETLLEDQAGKRL